MCVSSGGLLGSHSQYHCSLMKTFAQTHAATMNYILEEPGDKHSCDWLWSTYFIHRCIHLAISARWDKRHTEFYCRFSDVYKQATLKEKAALNMAIHKCKGNSSP